MALLPPLAALSSTPAALPPDLEWKTGAETRATREQTGNVGIGTMTPILHTRWMSMGKSILQPAALSFPTAPPKQPPEGAELPSGTYGQTLRHDGTNWLADSIIYNDGTKVGIGTALGSYKLNVSGTMNATTLYQNGSNVQLGWSTLAVLVLL